MEGPGEGEAAALVDAALDGFRLAAGENGNVIDRDFRLGALNLRLRFAGEAMVPYMAPAFRHLAAQAPVEPDLTVHLFDGAGGLSWLHSLPWPEGSSSGPNQPKNVHADGVHALFEPVLDHLYLADAHRGIGLYWIPEARRTPYWETSFPLRRIFHWWMAGRPLQPIHAGAVGFPDGGVLVAGRSGTGKSTTTLACLDSNLLFAGDDYVLARLKPEPWVHNLYGTAKLEAKDLHRFPHLTEMVSNASSLEEEKALLFLNDHVPDRLSPGFPLRAILVPEVSGRPGTKLRRAEPKHGFMAIAPTTVLHLKGASEEAFEKISALTRSVPNYVLEAGTDLAGIPAAIEELLKTGDLR